jgi:hypothetical protein
MDFNFFNSPRGAKYIFCGKKDYKDEIISVMIVVIRASVLAASF